MYTGRDGRDFVLQYRSVILTHVASCATPQTAALSLGNMYGLSTMTNRGAGRDKLRGAAKQP